MDGDVRLPCQNRGHPHKAQQVRRPQGDIQIQPALHCAVRRHGAAVLPAVARVHHHGDPGLFLGGKGVGKRGVPLPEEPRKYGQKHRQNPAQGQMALSDQQNAHKATPPQDVPMTPGRSLIPIIAAAGGEIKTVPPPPSPHRMNQARDCACAYPVQRRHHSYGG